ncbi:MAG: mycofactocin biosynthesis glycosyltransferase MftF [Geodermatophilaceae bacterium]
MRRDYRTGSRSGSTPECAGCTGAGAARGAPIRLLRLSGTAAALLGTGPLLPVRDGTTAALARRLLDTGVAHPRPAPPAAGGDGDWEVTVAVPVRDRPDGLERLLAAVRRTAGAIPILVVDDGSLDALAIRRVCARHAASVMRHETARGPAAARNSGLAAAATPYVALLDSDCVPLPGWLDRLLGHLQDSGVAAVAPRIVASEKGLPGWLSSYEEAASSLDLGPREGPVHPHGGVPYVPSAALLVRRAALGDGYDETMHVAEDVDLVWRLVADGWRVRYEPAALVAHEHRTSLGAWARRRAFYGTGAAQLAARHSAAVAPVVLSPGQPRPGSRCSPAGGTGPVPPWQPWRGRPSGCAAADRHRTEQSSGRPARRTRDGVRRTPAGLGGRAALLAAEPGSGDRQSGGAQGCCRRRRRGRRRRLVAASAPDAVARFRPPAPTR